MKEAVVSVLTSMMMSMRFTVVVELSFEYTQLSCRFFCRFNLSLNEGYCLHLVKGGGCGQISVWLQEYLNIGVDLIDGQLFTVYVTEAILCLLIAFRG